MDSTKLIGSGSFSKVYIGSYRKKKCAIKLIFTPDLTEDVIQRIGAEAQILSSINVSSKNSYKNMHWLIIIILCCVFLMLGFITAP